jgi:uncharacterized membrane protein
MGEAEVEVPPPRARRSVRSLVDALDEDRLAVVVLVLGTAAWVVAFSILVHYRVSRFSAFDFDMGIYDQGVWLLARGRMFSTVRGLPILGHHANVNLFLFAPFSWVGLATPTFLSNVQTLSLGLGAVAVFLIARFRLGQPWLAVALAFAYLAHPSLQWMTWELFHPDAMAILPLLFAYYFSIRKQWRLFAVVLGLALLWKEDVALVAFLMGLLIALRGDRRAGLVTAGAAAVWFLIATRVLIPSLHDEGPFYADFYGDLGDSTTEIAFNIVRHPGRTWRHLDDANAIHYIGDVFSPYGYTSFLAPTVVLLGVPQGLLNLLSVQSFTYDDHYHYVAMPLTAVTLAMIEGLALVRRWRPGLATFLVAFVFGCAMLNTGLRGTSAFSRDYERVWPLHPDGRQASKEAAVDAVPDDAAVSATYQLVPALTHRAEIYSFPNPWRTVNWAVRGEGARNPDRVDVLAIDRQVLGPEDQALVDCLLDRAVFRPVFDEQAVLVAVRVVGAVDTCPTTGRGAG